MKKAILIVDDEQIILWSMQMELESELGDEFIYETAQNGIEAIEVIEKLSQEGTGIILIVSDWVMPGMSGDEFLTKVHSKHPEIRTLLISGQAEEEKIKNILNQGIINMYLEKPWDHEVLIENCRKLIGL
jgi:DNA-binding NtrC family response regulator